MNERPFRLPEGENKSSAEGKKYSAETVRSIMSRHADMYQVPGSEPLSEKDFRRYIDSNAEFQRQIPSFIEQDLASGDWNRQKEACCFIRQTEDAVLRDELYASLGASVKRQSESSDLRLRLGAFNFIPFVPKEEQDRLYAAMADTLEKCLSSENPRLAADAAEKIGEIKDVSIKERLKTFLPRVVEKCFSDPDPRVRFMGLDIFENIPEESQALLVSQIAPVINACLDGNDLNLRVWAAEYEYLVPDQDRPDFLSHLAQAIENTLKSRDAQRRLSLVSFIRMVPTELREHLRQEHFAAVENMVNEYTDRWGYNSFYIVDTLPPSDAARLVRKAFDHPNIEVRIRAIPSIDSAPKEDRPALRELVPQIIRDAQQDPRSSVRQSAASMIEHAPQPAQASLRLGIRPPTEREMKELAANTPLYRDYQEPFFKRSFEKTGSGTTLLDIVPGQSENSLRNRLIIRHIRPLAYAAWEKAYEAADFWKKQGFDYVPIEPIVAVRAAKDSAVDVFSRVLPGPSLGTWKQENAVWAQEAEDDRQKIIKGLKKMGVQHGHDHAGNFIVLFPRSEKGEVLIGQKPRVYMIDFDAAILEKVFS